MLVAEANNNRVQQVRIVDGSWVRFVGEGVLAGPQYVDCNADVIAVSEECHRINVLSAKPVVRTSGGTAIVSQMCNRGAGCGLHGWNIRDTRASNGGVSGPSSSMVRRMTEQLFRVKMARLIPRSASAWSTLCASSRNDILVKPCSSSSAGAQ